MLFVIGRKGCVGGVCGWILKTEQQNCRITDLTLLHYVDFDSRTWKGGEAGTYRWNGKTVFECRRQRQCSGFK